jgi:hypothetical protein
LNLPFTRILMPKSKDVKSWKGWPIKES